MSDLKKDDSETPLTKQEETQPVSAQSKEEEEEPTVSKPVPTEVPTTPNPSPLPADAQPTKSEEPLVPPKKEEVLSEMQLSQVLKVNVPLIDFGELLPGQILEENLIIMNTLQTSKIPFLRWWAKLTALGFPN